MLRLVIIAAVAIASTLGATLPDGTRIVSGEPRHIHHHPYQVSLRKKDGHICGGALYSEDVVITAAHCLQGKTTPDQLTIRLGSSSRLEGGVIDQVKNFTFHPKYNSKERWYDVAVIRLETPVTFSDTIRPIDLATVTPPTGTPCIVTGWGVEKFMSFRSPSHLLGVELSIVSNKDCGSDQYLYGNSISETMLCTYSEGKDACQGDSGGPLVAGYQLVGVVSWGNGCGKKNYPGVYADVASLHSWLVEHAKTV